MFIFDHVHYTFWFSVHLCGLSTLENVLLDIHAEMTKGKFSFLKSNRQLSRMAADHAPEQNEKITKGVGGGSDLLN